MPRRVSLESKNFAAHACGTGHNRVNCTVLAAVRVIGFNRFPTVPGS
jgi:hypothetical protein